MCIFNKFVTQYIVLIAVVVNKYPSAANELSRNNNFPGPDDVSFEYEDIDKNRKDILESGEYYGERNEELVETVKVNIMVQDNEHVELPCITENSIASFIYERVIIEIKEASGIWSIKCQYSREMRVCEGVGNKTGYKMVGEDMLSIEVQRIGKYECALVGARDCTIDGRDYICWNYKLHIFIEVININEKPPPAKLIGPGSLTGENETTIPCVKELTTHEPSEINEEMLGTFETITTIHKKEESSEEELLGECSIDTLGAMECTPNISTAESLYNYEKNRMLGVIVVGTEQEMLGTYICRTRTKGTINSNNFCTEKFQEKGIWVINMWRCKNILLEYHETIYKGMRELIIKEISTSESDNVTIGQDFLVTANENRDNVNCTIHIGEMMWQEFDEIKADQVSSEALLRCCISNKGCNEIRPWIGMENEGYNWVIYPIVTSFESGGASHLLRLRIKNQWTDSLLGLCREKINEDYYKETYTRLIAMASVIVVASGILAINIFYIRRKKAVYLVGRSRERYSCHITYRPETPPSPGPPPPNSIGGQA